MAVDKFPHTERGIRRTFYPLVPCGDDCFITTGKMNQENHFINVSLDISNLQYDETKVEYCSNVKYGMM